MHPTPPPSFNRQQPRLPQYIPPQQQGRVPERHVVAGTKLQSNSRSGGGPSTGGVGGAAAAPCYGRGGGPGPSSSTRMPGFGGGGWSGEASKSGGGAPAGRSIGGASARGEDYDLYSDRRMHAAAHALSHSSSSHPNPHSNDSNEHPQQAQLSSQQQPYRQGPAMGDSNGGGGGGRGTKRDADGVAATTAAGANNGSVAPGSSNSSASNRDQALALYGLSALCQVASATAAVGGDEGEPRSQDTGAWDNRDSGFRDGRTQRFGGGDGSDGDGDFGHEQKRACTGESGAGSGVRRGGVWQRYNGDERDGRGRESSEEEEVRIFGRVHVFRPSPYKPFIIMTVSWYEPKYCIFFFM